MTMKKSDPIEPFFEAARNDAPKPSKELLSRIAADALRETKTNAATHRNESRLGFLDIIRSIGGWPVWSGIATASLVGLWVGANGVPIDPLELVGAYSLDADALYDEYGDFAWVAE